MSGKYALIIGNTEYTDPGLAQLSAPGKDAKDFARVLSDRELCAFDEVNTILNEPSSSVSEIIDEFFDQKKPDDLLVLYFSGHGIRDEFGSLYLAFKNTVRSRLRSTALKSDYIKEVMDQSRSKRQVLILDCCNSGAFPQGTKAEVGGAMGMVSALQGYGRFVLTASDATQFAWEGNKIIGETDNSLFTHFLVKGLRGDADSDGDGKITVDELYDYAYDQIARVTPKQTPTKSSSKQEGEIVLRQFTNVEDIKHVSLPTPLMDSIENPFADIRLGAVQELTKLLNGKNLGLARSAKEALQRIVEGDDSNRVKLAAKQALESFETLNSQRDQVSQKATNEPKTQERFIDRRAETIKAAREREKQERQLKLQQKPTVTAELERKAQAQKLPHQPNRRYIFASIGIGILFLTCTIGSVIWRQFTPPPLNTVTVIVTTSASFSIPSITLEYTPTPSPTDTPTATFISTYTFIPSFTPTDTPTSTITPTPTSVFQSYLGKWVNQSTPVSNYIDYALTWLIINQKDNNNVTFTACWRSKTSKDNLSLSPSSITGNFNNNNVLGGDGFYSSPNKYPIFRIEVSLSNHPFLIVTVYEKKIQSVLVSEIPENFTLRRDTSIQTVLSQCSPPTEFIATATP